MSNKEEFIKEKIDGMSLDQKVGHLMTLGFNGTILTPNIFDYVSKYHCGGLRITPPDRIFGNYVDPKTGKVSIDVNGGSDIYYKQGGVPPELTGQEYKQVLDTLMDLADQRPGSLPLHLSFDNEGEGNCSFKGFSMFPQPMGLMATGDTTIAYEVAKVLGRQARSVGMNMIHSPVLDVNGDARNPEINIRSYSDKAEQVAEFAAETCRGFKEVGIATAGKHFPGRGHSSLDAHYELPVIEADLDTLWNRDLLPYRHLIDLGLLPGIMLAHSIYPAVDPDEVGSVSKKMITGLLREKMGFEGVVTTDSMTMAGIANRYSVPEACAMSLAAGADLVLMKAQNNLVGESFNAIKAYVEDGRINEEDVDRKLTRILGMKVDIGLFVEEPTREEPDDLVVDLSIKQLEKDVAEKACVIIRQEEDALPLQRDQRFLLVEQITTERNNLYQHSAKMFKETIPYSKNFAFCETGFSADEEDQVRINNLVPEFDTIVLTNFMDRTMVGSKAYFEELIQKHPEKTFIVVTNKPYAFAVPEAAKTVICNYSKAPESLTAAVRLLFGEFEATGRLPGNSDV